MSLRNKIVSILLIAGMGYGLVDLAVQKWIILPSFEEVEDNRARINMDRCILALQNEVEHLNRFCYDWSAWDDTALYVQGKKEEFIQQTITDEVFLTQHLNALIFLDAKGNYVWGQVVKLGEDEVTPLEITELTPENLCRNTALISHSDPEHSVAGILLTSAGPIMISSRPITNNLNTPPVVGTLIMARLVNDEMMNPLSKQTQVDFEWWSLASAGTQQALQPYLSKLASPDSSFLEKPEDENIVAVFKTFPDIHQNSSLLIRAKTPRDISARGITAIRFALFSLLGGGCVILVVLLIMLEKIIIKPLNTVNLFALDIGRSGDLTSRIHLNGRDEIASLADSFNQMVAQLHQARVDLMERSYRAGIAELASGILHNVRNALTSLRVEIESLNQQIQDLPLQHIRQARQELDNPDLPPQRRKELEHFMSMASQTMTETIDRLADGFQNIADPIVQIEQSLMQPDRLSRSADTTEQFKITEILHDCIALLPKGSRQDIDIRLDPGLSSIASLHSNRVALTHILCNLLSNSVDSIRSAGVNGIITIKGGLDMLVGKRVLHLVVQDNGCGITEDQLRQIFKRGFTTKQTVSRGMGLHWCANTINAMNGRIWAESQGPNQGAAFHVLFPYEPAAEIIGSKA
ncbi:MAG: HAMP domain-containing protein [Sedimentisphaerales bacterium]|nr:HAMP domain-containing protein [Sedimentisphaerales bacterium]